MSSNAKNLIEYIEKFKQLLESGQINKSNWLTDQSADGSDVRFFVKGALSKEFRTKVYDNQRVYDEADMKACDPAFNSLAQLATKKGIVYDEVMALLEQYPAYGAVLADIKKVNEYMSDPKVGALRLTESEELWLVRAVSKSERADWADTFLGSSPANIKNIFVKELDKLAAVASKTIPNAKPQASSFANKNAAEEKLMMEQMTSGLKVHQIGIESKTWKVQKNALDVPQLRFKTGYMWVRNPKDDHPYCKLCQLSIIQDYSGGGTYGESYGKFLACWLVSCP